MRPGDLVVRLGGEEVLVVLTGEPAEISSIAERLRTQVARCHTRSRSTTAVPVTVSIGVAWCSADEGQEHLLNGLLHAADERMYQAKAAGRDTVVLPAA